MSNSILILGESGTGKSTSIRKLPSKETFIVNVIGKPLPFRGAKSHYTKLTPEGEGNYYANDNTASILKLINFVNNKRTEIKYLVLDDFGYMITNSFMRKSNQKGFEKFNELGREVFDVLDLIGTLRDDLYIFVMMHTEVDQMGKYKPKTVGRMIDQYICIEGKFSYVFHALVLENGYKFLTNNDGVHISKSPLGMFEDLHVDNDLIKIVKKIKEYEDSDEENGEDDASI